MTTSTTDTEAIARIIEALISIASDAPKSILRDAVIGEANEFLAFASREEAQEPVQITMQDVRLMAGEGPLTAKDTLAAVNAHLRRLHRHTAPPAPAGEVERLRAAIKRQVENIDRWRETGEPASPEESKSIYEQLVAALNGGREKGK